MFLILLMHGANMKIKSEYSLHGRLNQAAQYVKTERFVHVLWFLSSCAMFINNSYLRSCK